MYLFIRLFIQCAGNSLRLFIYISVKVWILCSLIRHADFRSVRLCGGSGGGAQRADLCADTESSSDF